MHRLSDPVHFRRSIGGLSLIIAPLLLLAGTIIGPESGAGTAGYLRATAENPEATGVATVLWFLGFVVLTAGVAALIHLVRDRAIVLGHAGGILAFAGAIAFAALVVTSIYDIALAEKLPLAQGVAVTEAIEDNPAGFWVFVPALLGTAVGLVLLTAALWRGGMLPVWVFPLVLAGFVVLFVSGDEKILRIIGNAVIFAGLAVAGWTVLSMRDGEWLRPPRSQPGDLEQRERGADVSASGARPARTERSGAGLRGRSTARR